MFRRKVAPGIELRQLGFRDADLLFAAVERNRQHLRQWLPWVDHTRSIEDIRRFLSRVTAQLEANQGPSTAIWVDDTLAGSVGCHPIDWANHNCSLGYWIDAAHQGKGLITRCCATLMDYLFHDAGLHRIEIRCGVGNTRSCAVPERLGFTREGVSFQAEWVNDRWVDLVIWGMLEADWPKRR